MVVGFFYYIFNTFPFILFYTEFVTLMLKKDFEIGVSLIVHSADLVMRQNVSKIKCQACQFTET